MIFACMFTSDNNLYLGVCVRERERVSLANLDSILKSKDITLPPKIYIVKVMVFPVVYMDGRVGP